jgi:hypothetical protein
VSSTSTTSASRPRPPATTNRQSFNLLTATTRLTRSLLQSVRSHVGRSSATAWSSPARAGLRLAMPSGDVCSDWLRPRTVVNQAVEPAHASVRIGRCYSSTRSLFAQRQLSRPNLRKVHGPHGVLARRPGVVHHYHGESRSALGRASLRSASWVSNGLSRERTLAILGQFGGLGSTTTGKCATP